MVQAFRRFQLVRVVMINLVVLIAGITVSLGGQSHVEQGEESRNKVKSTPAIAVEDLELHETAIARMLGSDYQGWKFRQIADDGEDVVVEHFDSSLPEEEQWTLVSKNDREPSAGDLRKYNKEKEKKRESNAASEVDESSNDFLRVIVKPGTLRVTERNNDRITYSFRPHFTKDEEKDMEDYVFGTITVNSKSTENPWVEEVHLFNLEEFKTGGARIREFQQIISFAPIGEGAQAPVFFKKVHMKIKGRAYGLFGFDKKVDVDFSEYQRVTD